VEKLSISPQESKLQSETMGPDLDISSVCSKDMEKEIVHTPFKHYSR